MVSAFSLVFGLGNFLKLVGDSSEWVSRLASPDQKGGSSGFEPIVPVCEPGSADDHVNNWVCVNLQFVPAGAGTVASCCYYGRSYFTGCIARPVAAGTRGAPTNSRS